MKYFEVNTKDILKAVKEVSISIDNNSDELKLTNIRIETIGLNKIKLSGTNLNTTSRTFIDSNNFMMDKEIFISNILLMEILKAADSDKLLFEIDNSELKIIGNKEKFKTCFMVQEDHPIKFEDERIDKFLNRSEKVEINSLTLNEIVKRLKVSISKESYREELKNIYFEIIDNKIEIVTSDSRRISIAYIKTNISNMKIGLINIKDLEKLLKLIGKKDINIEMFISDQQVIYKIDNFHLMLKVINKPFIPYKRLIPTEQGEKIIINTKKFINILKKIKFIACENSYTLYLKFDNNNLKIKAQSRSGSAIKELDIMGNSNILIGVNLLFLMDYLKNIKSSEFKINIFGVERQFILTELNNKFNFEQKYIAMPVRIRKGEVEFD